MKRGFSSEVKQALNDIYYNVGTRKGAEGFALLEQASAAGDGDASCILARCLCGKQYVWPGHGFPVDDARVEQLLHKSVEQGSALGVLVCMRTGELTPALQRKCPFPASKKLLILYLKWQKLAMLSASIRLETLISGGILWKFKGKTAPHFPAMPNSKHT